MSFRMTDLLAELLLKAQQLKALERPSNRDYRSVLNFMENDGGQLYKKDFCSKVSSQLSISILSSKQETSTGNKREERR